MLTQAQLKQLLDYDENTGIFAWRLSRGRVRAGQVAGSVGEKGYLLIGLHGGVYKAHQLAWLYVHGEFPGFQLDHEARVKTNNKIKNLRKATGTQNCQNRKLRADNTSGYRGVFKFSETRWLAYCTVDGVQKPLGTHPTALAASEVREKFAEEHFKGFYSPLETGVHFPELTSEPCAPTVSSSLSCSGFAANGAGTDAARDPVATSQSG